MADSLIAQAIRKQKEALEAFDEAALRQLARDWLGVEKGLQGAVDSLAQEISTLAEAGKAISLGKQYQLGRLQNLLVQAQGETAKYAGRAAEFIAGKQAESLALGVRHATSILDDFAVGGQFDRLGPLAVESMIANTAGTVADGAPLRKLLFERMVRGPRGGVLPGVQERLIGTLRDAVAQGWNPKKTAKLIQNDLAGGLEKALTISRTETLRAYRYGAAESYKTSGVVDGQMRMAAHTSTTCAACLADEGTIYPVDEPIPDHPRGRCVGVPMVEGMPPPEFENGEEWLKKQPEKTQRGVLGSKRFDAWKNGDVKFSQFASATHDATWGGGLQVKSLSELGIQPKPTKAPSKPASSRAKAEKPLAAKSLGEANKNIEQVRSATPRDVDRYAPINKDMTDLYEYVGTNRSFEINSQLRAGAVGAQNKGVVRTLDKLTKTGTIRKPQLLYRRIEGGVFADPKSAVGSVFTDDGYMSTSLVDKFYGSIGKRNTLMRITAPKGTKGLAVDAYGAGNMEAEFILPRGSKLRIDKVTQTKTGWDIDATVVGT